MKPVAVEVTLLDGSRVFGKICVPLQGRLSDTLNDDRSFVPVECVDGTFLALAKRAIKQVALPSSAAAIYQGEDPYRILGVKPGTSPEDLRKAYHELCAVHHPDRIRGLGLGAEYEQLATHNMARINTAYAQISKRTAN
ncbi:MAG TPA: J domain-containing protein [Rhizomicrobium sp.]|nr:J domain-containing protein [Rhizomicrobium sp.]